MKISNQRQNAVARSIYEEMSRCHVTSSGGTTSGDGGSNDGSPHHDHGVGEGGGVVVGTALRWIWSHDDDHDGTMTKDKKGKKRKERSTIGDDNKDSTTPSSGGPPTLLSLINTQVNDDEDDEDKDDNDGMDEEEEEVIPLPPNKRIVCDDLRRWLQISPQRYHPHPSIQLLLTSKRK